MGPIRSVIPRCTLLGMSLMDAFWQEESSPFIRQLLLGEAAGRSSGVAAFNFNMFDVVLDFDTGTAVITDALNSDHPTEETDLVSFLHRAGSFNDDPSLGDGRTSLERTPSKYAVGSDGEVARLGETGSALPDGEVLAARSAWFDFYTKQRNVFAPPGGGPYTCPCCGHRTLHERGAYEICRQCGWEDDGQDDHDSAVVRGGPNGRLSLDAARVLYRAEGGESERHVIPSGPV